MSCLSNNVCSLQNKHFSAVGRSDVNERIVKDVFEDIKQVLRNRPDYDLDYEERFCAETTTAFKCWYRSQKHQEVSLRAKKQAATVQASDEETPDQKARRQMFDENDTVETMHMTEVDLAPAGDSTGVTEGGGGGEGAGAGAGAGADGSYGEGGGSGSVSRNGCIGEGSGESQDNLFMDDYDEEAGVTGAGKGKAKAGDASGQGKPDDPSDSEATIDDIMEDRDLDGMDDEPAADENGALPGGAADGIPRKMALGTETVPHVSPPSPRNRRRDRLDDIARKIERDNAIRETAMVEQAKAFNDIAGAFTKIVDRLALAGSTVSASASSRDPQSTLELMLRLQREGVCTFGPAEYNKHLEALGVKAIFPGYQAGPGRAGLAD